MSNALILSGGGARAAYQVGVLKAVAELLPANSPNPFPIICGTSAGAISAVGLAAYEGSFQEAVARLERIWMSLEPGDIYRHGWFEILRSAGRLGFSLFNQGVGIGKPISLLDNRPLRGLLKNTIKFGEIDRAIARGDLEAVCVTAMGYSSGHSVSFFQAKPDIEPWKRYRRKGRRTLLGLDHLMASSAIPTVFPSNQIEHEYYGDGALRQLTPLSPALHLGADQLFIVGVSGNRDPNVENRQTVATHSPSIAQILGHMFNSAFIDSLDVDMEHLERINQLTSEPCGARTGHLKPIGSVMVSPSQELDRIAGRNIHHLPSSLQTFLRITGATETGGGATAASYLLFAKPFIEELIVLGHRDAMWESESIMKFFNDEPHDPAASGAP